MTGTLPDFNFLTVDPQVILNEMIHDYEMLTDRKLADADPVRLFILAQADKIIQLSNIINDSAKQNLLYFSRNEVLDFKGYEWDTPRLGNDPAKTTMRFFAAIIQSAARIIPKGTLVTAGDEVFFETTSDAIIAANTEYVDVEAVCQTPGVIGNGYQIGEINTMVKPLIYVSSCTNITVSEGGTVREDDVDYRNRIRQAPEKLSTAGPSGAYEYFAKSASALINDVHAYMSTPGTVTVKVLLKDGELPGTEILDAVEDKLSTRSIRPLTDNLVVGAPDIVACDLDFTYYLPSDISDVTAAKNAVESAIKDYKKWQTEKMGRDINPSQLIWYCIKAGAKRVDVRTPSYTQVAPYEVAQLNTENIIFGGVEND